MAIERIQLRRGTAEQWATTNPILGAAEMGVELGTPIQFKLGDGSSTWNELDYFTSGSSDFIAIAEKGVANGVATLDSNGAIPTGQLANLINSAPSTLDTLSELAAALADDADFAVTITGQIADKADIGHTHVSADITDLPDLSGYTTALSDISTLQSDLTTLENTVTTLDYATSSHTHDASEITNTVITITSSTYAIQASDNGKTLVLDPSSGSITITVDDVFSPGQRVDLYLRGTSATINGGTGQLEAIGNTMGTQYSVASIMCFATGLYSLAGNVE